MVGGGGYGRGELGGNFVHAIHIGGFCFCKRHMGWGVYRNEPALRPAGTPPPGSSAGFSAKIIGGGLGRPNRPAETTVWPLHFRPSRHRCGASPPFHSDELPNPANPPHWQGL